MVMTLWYDLEISILDFVNEMPLYAIATLQILWCGGKKNIKLIETSGENRYSMSNMFL